MTILSYGEDAFTLHALKYGLQSILTQLDDPTAGSEALVLFRPSFGRGTRAAAGRVRSTFGEPDALIGTPAATYIVEAKWNLSGEREPAWNSVGERNGEIIKLRSEQILRHKIMRAYLESWRELQPRSWSDFAESASQLLGASTPGFVPPRQGTRLAQSLEFVLRRLESSGPVKDVLLYCHPERDGVSSMPSCQGFHVVRIGCPAIADSHFVVIDGTLESPVIPT